MRRLFQFILSHSIFIAFCAAALSFQTGQLMGIAVSGYLLSFIFFGVLAGYNAYWLISRYSFSSNHSLRSLFATTPYSFLVLISAFLGMLFCFNQFYWIWSNMLIAGILFVLYLLPILPFKQLEWIRRIGFLKTVLLAFTWAIITTLIPLQVPIWAMGALAILVFIGRFLFIVLFCIIFDKRDAGVDKIRGLQSLATVFRPMILHFLIAFIFIGYIGISYFMKGYGVKTDQVIALTMIGLVTLIMYIVSMQKKGYLFYYFGVDGLMFFSAFLTWLAGEYCFV
jgi:hypothetical protein